MREKPEWYAIGALTMFVFAFALNLSYAQTSDVTSTTVIAFIADADQDKPQPLWRNILDAHPNLFLFLGDNVYLDTANEEVMRENYAKLGAMPGYLEFLARSIPTMETWDDHDYGANDAGAELPQKEISKRVFLDFFRAGSDDIRRKRSGVYDAKIFGEAGERVQVIALDLRSFRSPLNPPPYTMLGEEQWQWLADELKKPAEIRLIMSSIQLIQHGNGWENWGNFPLERDRLFTTIRDTGAQGVVILSGDRHFSELSIMNAGVGYPLYDFTIGSFKKAPKTFSAEKNSYRLTSTQPQPSENFGIVKIAWGVTGQPTTITLEARTLGNKNVLQRSFPLALLQRGVIPIVYQKRTSKS